MSVPYTRLNSVWTDLYEAPMPTTAAELIGFAGDFGVTNRLISLAVERILKVMNWDHFPVAPFTNMD